MLESYVSAGLPPGRFWKITPRLYMSEMRGAAARITREHNDLAWAAWHIAYLPKAKRMVPLADLQAAEPKEKRIATWQNQLSQWEAFAAKGG